MEFTGFRPQGLDLLIENRLQNSKEFYEAHKTQIQALVNEPFYALIERMTPVMREIDPLFVIQPKRMLSRVRRDTRYTHDKTLYRDHAWIAFGRAREERFAERPVYYFEITPEYYGYGCGYYQAPPSEMRVAREMILAGDQRFSDAFRAVNTQSRFTLYGDSYKRPKYPDAPAQYQPWLNRKNLGLACERTDFDSLFDGSFVETMLDGFAQIAPFYHFLCAIKERAQSAEKGAAR